MAVALALLVVAVALAAALLMESQQQLVDVAGEQGDPAVELVVGRMRSDVLSSASFAAASSDGVNCTSLTLLGHPAGTVVYRRAGSLLLRGVSAPGAPAGAGSGSGEGIMLRGVTRWSCQGSGRLLYLSVSYRRHAVRRSPLALLPGLRGPATEDHTESLFLTPRAAGLGGGW